MSENKTVGNRLTRWLYENIGWSSPAHTDMLLKKIQSTRYQYAHAKSINAGLMESTSELQGMNRALEVQVEDWKRAAARAREEPAPPRAPHLHPMSEAPKDGSWINVATQETYRFLPYKPQSTEAKRGIKGRWQRGEWLEHGPVRWTNCPPPTGEGWTSAEVAKAGADG